MILGLYGAPINNQGSYVGIFLDEEITYSDSNADDLTLSYLQYLGEKESEYLHAVMVF